MSGSANSRVSASSAVGGGSSTCFAPVRRAFFVLDGGGALGIPELRQLQLEIVRRVQVVLKQKLHRAFARFASFAHEIKSNAAEVQSLKREMSNNCARLWTLDFATIEFRA